MEKEFKGFRGKVKGSATSGGKGKGHSLNGLQEAESDWSPDLGSATKA